ncbi:MAG: type II CRISPR-associated endonuclease Cas1 [Sphingomonadales bacterium]
MIDRIVEIAEDGRHLSVSRGFLVVSADGEELGRVPLDDIGAVIATGHGLTYTGNLIHAFVERDISMVFCGDNFHPAAILWPVDGHHLQTARMRCQIDAAKPLCKRLWQGIVRAKVMAQAAAVEAVSQPSGAFETLARAVRSGDPENIEAQAARRYWPLLFGRNFRRDRNKPGVNGMLNYGYAIIRSATARAVMAAGLHPSIGIHHHNRSNPMCLVDDIMEPFRPVVDLRVHGLVEAGHNEVTAEIKPRLAAVLTLDMYAEQGVSPVGLCIQRLATSLARSFEAGKPVLELPLKPLPAELAAFRTGS